MVTAAVADGIGGLGVGKTACHVTVEPFGAENKQYSDFC